MYYQELPKDFLKAFKVPRHYKALAWIVVIVILVVGTYLSFHHANWMWLARFGSLIAIISLLIEASGLIQSYIDRVIKVSAELTFDIVKMQVIRLPHMYGLSGDESEIEIDQIAKKEHSRRISDINFVMEKSISSDIRKTEFLIGSLGTIVWGFGDLLGKLFGQ